MIAGSNAHRMVVVVLEQSSGWQDQRANGEDRRNPSNDNDGSNSGKPGKMRTIMKYDGIEVTKTADGKIDREALFLEWLDKDAKEQPLRFQAWEKNFLETMAVKGVWFPAIHEQLIGFLKIPAYQQQWLALTLVTDMLYGSMLSNGKIPLDKASGIKELISEYLESQCGDSIANPDALLFSEGKKKGKGVSIKFRLNPKYRDSLNAPPPAADAEPESDAASDEQAAA